MKKKKSKNRRFGLGAKIAVLPLLGLLALFLIKGIDLYISAKVGSASSMGQYGSNIAWMMTERVLLETEFLSVADDKIYEQVKKQSIRIDKTLSDAKALDTGRELHGYFEEISKAVVWHQKAFSQVAEVVVKLKDTKEQFITQLNNCDKAVMEAINAVINEKTNLIMMEGTDLPENKKSLQSGFREAQGFVASIMLNVNELLAFSDAKRFEETAENLSKKMKLSFENTGGMVDAVNEEGYKGHWKKIRSAYVAMQEKQAALYDQWKKLQVLAANLDKTNIALKKSLSDIVAATKQKIVEIQRLGFWISTVTIGFAVVVLLLLSVILIRSVTKPINSIVSGLNKVAEEVANAANQVSQVSNQLDRGSSNQAASIEETSSSLEEMAAMTKQNAENAKQTNALVIDTSNTVEAASTSMGQLTEAMQAISKSSKETQRIIKTIDEIAFQTNLLALNAAVEAARAGEVGAGFAVVADEVRNLALRAAEAAKTTGDLIEGSVKQIKTGSDVLAKSNSEFARVAEGSSKVSELVSEITAASQEQAQGIEQVNVAVSEMDKVTQQNASTAQESTAVSEEMNFRAKEMKDFVSDLATLVGGKAGGKVKTRTKKSNKAKKKKAHEEMPEQAALPTPTVG